MKKIGFLVGALLLVGVLSGCNGQFPVISPVAVTDLTNAICSELEANQQTDTSAVQFVCSLLGTDGKPAVNLIVSVPKSAAPTFAASHKVPASK